MHGRSRLGRLGRAAAQHAARGLAVFPLSPGRKGPALKEENWQTLATTDRSQIEDWWSTAPYNIGVATGQSGLLVVDLDLSKHADDVPPAEWASRGAKSGADALALLAADHGAVPATYTVTTCSGGRHLYFRQPGGQQLPNTAGRLGWKIDTRGDGGYVVGAGSVVAGRYYTDSGTRQPQTLPGWIADLLTTPEPSDAQHKPGPIRRHTDTYALAALTGELDKLLAATEGHRNHALNTAAFVLGTLVGADMLDETTTRAELISAAGRIGLPRAEAERTITSGLTAGARKPRARC